VISELVPKVRYTPGDEVLRIENLSTPKRTVIDATLAARAGEIVGLAGLVGSGKSEVMRAAFGVAEMSAGRVFLKGKEVSGASTHALLDQGLFYLPPDRREEGLVMMRSCRENIALPSLDRPPFSRGWFLDRGGEARRVAELADRMNLQPRRIERAVDFFSGGNQQKVMLAKCLTRPVEVFVFDEPTVGVDVGTRAAIYGFIRDLCEAGAAVVLISSDLPEILNLTARVYIFYRGRIRAEIEGDAITEENVLRHFFEREAA
jgi:ribose transport system ATP-binding protein